MLRQVAVWIDDRVHLSKLFASTAGHHGSIPNFNLEETGNVMGATAFTRLVFAWLIDSLAGLFDSPRPNERAV